MCIVLYNSGIRSAVLYNIGMRSTILYNSGMRSAILYKSGMRSAVSKYDERVWIILSAHRCLSACRISTKYNLFDIMSRFHYESLTEPATNYTIVHAMERSITKAENGSVTKRHARIFERHCLQPQERGAAALMPVSPRFDLTTMLRPQA